MKTKPFTIPKQLFVEAYKLVKANAGAAGVDQQSLTDFEEDLKNNLYKLWNRMSSGSYFPPPVKAVAIPKKSGKGKRVLGVPTVGDRICQTVVKLVFEPTVERHFLADSYGYRPNKSALDAVSVTRKRCWQYDWVLEFDIVGLFDNISHSLLKKAIEKHTDCKWVKLYIDRWLIAPLENQDGTLTERTAGVPQGSVIGPVLSNLFLHYVFDLWMSRNYPNTPWCRYADDGLAHGKTEQAMHGLLNGIRKRFAACGLALHPDKTKIVYCKDANRKGKYHTTAFDFLGYTFRPRSVMNLKTKQLFVSFTPAVSRCALKSMRQRIRALPMHKRSDLELEEIAKYYNPILRGWANYYGAYNRSSLYPVWRYVNKRLIAWAGRKYKRLKDRKGRATKRMIRIAQHQPNLFYHWRIGMEGSFT